MSASPSTFNFKARQLSLPRPHHTISPNIPSFLYDAVSSTLALKHSDSSFSIYPSASPFDNPSFPSSAQTLIPPPISSATFLHIQARPDSDTITTLFVSSSLIPRSSAIFLRFHVLRDGRFVKIKIVSNHRDLCYDEGNGGALFGVNHGVSVRLSGGLNYFSLYSVSDLKIWIFAARLVEGDGALKVMKCAVINCLAPVFEVRVLFGFLVLGEEGGVRVFPIRQMVKGRFKKEKKISRKRGANSRSGESNAVSIKGEKKESKHSESVKLRVVKTKQDSGDFGSVFVAFDDDKDVGSSLGLSEKSIKAISVQALSANYFVVLDSSGCVHLLSLSYSVQGFHKPCSMKLLSQTLNAQKLAVFSDVSAVTQSIWLSDGSHTVQILMADMSLSADKSEKKDSAEQSIQTSVMQTIFTSEKIQEIIPLASNALLVLGQGHVFISKPGEGSRFGAILIGLMHNILLCMVLDAPNWARASLDWKRTGLSMYYIFPRFAKNLCSGAFE